MINSVITYAGIHPQFGIGNALRMKHLVDFIRFKYPKTRIDYLVINKEKAITILQDCSFRLVDLKSMKNHYEIALYDSVFQEMEILNYLNQVADKCIGFDFFQYENQIIDVIINLYNHYSDRVNLFNGEVYQGVDYAILSDKILKNRNVQPPIKNKESILITFGGEDPNSNTLKVLEKLDCVKANLTVLVGKYNKDKENIYRKYKDKHSIIDQVNNIEDYFLTHDIIMCGGGTTMLEGLCLGKPIIALAQNNYENDFIKYIHQYVPIFTIQDIPQMLEIVKGPKKLSRISETYKSFIDGKGKERICSIIEKTLLTK